METKLQNDGKLITTKDTHYILIYKAPTHKAYFLGEFVGNKDDFDFKSSPKKIIMPLSKAEAIKHVKDAGLLCTLATKIPKHNYNKK